MSRDCSVRQRGRFRILAGVLALVLVYPLSLGPVCWTMSRLQCERRYPGVGRLVSRAYVPLAPMIVNGPRPVQAALKGWMGLGMSSTTAFHDDWPQGVGWSHAGYTYTLWHY
jgi:hypothetical protein